MNGHIEFTTIYGPITRKEILFGIYLPENYQKDSHARFPVLYHLHGLNEDCTDHLESLARTLEQGVAQGVVPPMVVVAPHGYANSMWVDSKDGRKPAETNVIRELLPHIENTYRVMPDRRQRIIAGFSMGGYGAIRYALKFPYLFSMCISMDGAIHNLKSLKAIRGPIFTEIFEEDGDYFKSQCVFELAKRNAQRVNGSVFFIILVGLLRSFNQRFRRHMTVSGLPIQDRYYVETGCDHDAVCILEQQGQRLFAQIGAHLSGKANSES